MGFLHLIGWLILIGVVLWALNYLATGYIAPWILDLINRLAVVAVVILVAAWLISLLSILAWPVNWTRVWNGP